ncbi:MAG: hypothetical protein ABSF60_04935 [Verrucomicrobiota bacterium]
MRIGRKPGIQPFLFAAVIGLLATGCKTYEQQNHVIQYWHQGNMTNAVAEATKMADQNAKNKDAIIWRLEQGAVLRGAGKYDESNKAFDQVQDRIDQYSQEAKVRVGQEAGALLSNQANLAYEGRSYDGVMLNTYKALNYLQLGEPDKARVELIRAYQRQQDAVEANKKRIAKVQEEADKSKDKATMDKAEQDPKFKSQMQGAYTGLDNLKVYADYVNPFTVYLDGLFFMADAADGSDLERAHKSLERVVGFDPDNIYAKQDLAAVNDLINGKPLSPTTYVIFETGCAPVRDQIRIDIPIIVSKVSYVGAAFPTLKPQGNYLPSLTISANSIIVPAQDTVATTATSTTAVTTTTAASEPPAAASSANTVAGDTNTTITSTTVTTGDTNSTGSNTVTTTSNTNSTVTSTTVTSGDTNATVTSTTTTASSTTATVTAGSTTASTSPIANMDSVIGLDFKNELPVVITKTIASTITKAVAAYAANQAASQQSDIAGLFMQLGTAIYQAAVNIADERTWTTLPKEFQVCRFSTPPDRKIVLETPDGAQKIPVTIEDGMINIVYVRSITATSPMLVTQFKLK